MPWKEWRLGDPITINRVVWGEPEERAMRRVLDGDWFGPGTQAAQLEAWMAMESGTEYAQCTNSGSSALLLSVQALLHTGAWRKGDLILHPACTFPTSINPIIQSGLTPVLVDVEPGTYNLDARAAEAAIRRHPKIAGAIVPHLLGNTTDIDRLTWALSGRPWVEDCCDTLGTTWRELPVGGYGVTGCFSFYGSHHITAAGVGGCLVTSDEGLYDVVRSMTFWGREQFKSTDPMEQFAHRYAYDTLGYDMQLSELQAAFALAQTERYPQILAGRQRRFGEMYDLFREYADWFVLPWSHEHCTPSWFGFPLEVKNSAPFTRDEFAAHLLANKVEIRPMFAGNIAKQAAYADVPMIVDEALTQATRNLTNALFLPAWPFMTDELMAELTRICREFLLR